MITKDDITAVILAGGKGRRLGGKDKGLVPYMGKPLIEHVLERIKPQVDHILINANRNCDQYAEYGYPVIADANAGYLGPLAGVVTAMDFAKTSYILTLPCDGPVFPSDLVSRMIAAIQAAPNPNQLAIAHDGKRSQFVYALIPVSLQKNLNEFIEKGERRAGLWLTQGSFATVDFSDIPQAFININTAEDLQT